MQLRALCDAADIDTFSPLSREGLTDQRTPALILQLCSIWEEVSALGVTRGIIDHKGTRPQASSERIGRYTYFAGSADEENQAGAWFGLHFRLWKKHGTTPLWAVFSPSNWGQGRMQSRRHWNHGPPRRGYLLLPIQMEVSSSPLISPRQKRRIPWSRRYWSVSDRCASAG